MLSTNTTVFLCVAKEGSFSQAAKKLFITSTAVMKHINNLEAELGFPIFTRTNQGVSLTEAGDSLNQELKKIQKKIKVAVHEARRLSSATAMIRLGTAPLTPGTPLINLWNGAYGNFPDYQLAVVQFDENHTNILNTLDSLETSFDLFVAPCDSKTWLEHANFLHLGNYSVELAVPRNHPLAAKNLLEVTDFSDMTIIVLKEGDSQTLDEVRHFLLEKNQQLTIESSDFYDIDTFNHAIKNNFPILTLNGWKDLHPSFKTIPVKWQYQIPYGIIYAKHPSPIIEEFIDTVAAIQMSQP